MLGRQLQSGWQVLCQRLQLATQYTGQVTAAVGLEQQGLEHVALNIQRQRPRLAVLRRKLQLPFCGQWPVAFGFQQAIEVQNQRIALQVRAVDLQTCGGPVCRQLEVSQLLDAIELQAAQLYIAQLQRERQLERG